MDYEVAISHESGRHLAVVRFDARPQEMAEQHGRAFGAVVLRQDPLGGGLGELDAHHGLEVLPRVELPADLEGLARPPLPLPEPSFSAIDISP